MNHFTPMRTEEQQKKAHALHRLFRLKVVTYFDTKCAPAQTFR